MTKISYELVSKPSPRVRVRLGRKLVGYIAKVDGGYAYHVSETHKGETLETVQQVKDSIEEK